MSTGLEQTVEKLPHKSLQNKRRREDERRVEELLGPEVYALTVGESPFDEFDENGFVVAKPRVEPQLTEQMREDFRLLDEHAEQILADLGARLEELENRSRRGVKSLMLAPTLELCRALLRGERVPWNVLAYFQAKRYGIRHGSRRGDGRYGLDDFNDVRAPE